MQEHLCLSARWQRERQILISDGQVCRQTARRDQTAPQTVQEFSAMTLLQEGASSLLQSFCVLEEDEPALTRFHCLDMTNQLLSTVGTQSAECTVVVHPWFPIAKTALQDSILAVVLGKQRRGYLIDASETKFCTQ